MTSARKDTRLSTIWKVLKITFIILSSFIWLLLYLVDGDEGTLLGKITVPDEKVGVDMELRDDILSFPRSGMHHKDAVVLMEDFSLLRSSNQPELPTCPPGVRINGDQAALETLRHCSGVDWNTAPLPVELAVWKYTAQVACEGKIVVHHKDVAMLKDVIIDKAFCEGRPCSENVDKVLGSGFGKSLPVKLEFGFFLVPCMSVLKMQLISFRGGSGNHVNDWVKALMSYEYPQELLVDDVIDVFTIAVRRYEYWNLYHSISDLYNAFMVTRYYNITPAQVNIVFIDGNGRGPFYDVWRNSFDNVTSLDELPAQTLFRKLFWNKLGYESEFLDHSELSLPLVAEFRKFILTAYGLPTADRQVDCKKINIVVISRQNYDGRIIARKISNEQELILQMKQAFKDASIKLLRLETLSFKDQIKSVVEADILIGMHGAGMTHALFLPFHGFIFEIVPHKDSWNLSDGHFKGIATWRNLKYTRWQNMDKNNEIDSNTTNIPIDVMNKNVREIISSMCEP